MLDFRDFHPDHSPHRTQAERLTRSYFARGFASFHITPFPFEILFDLRGKTAGIASCATRNHAQQLWNVCIRYNFLLLSQNSERFLAQTVPHEVAHIIAIAAFGTSARGHGKAWKHVMASFGIVDSSRCHSFDTSNSGGRRQRRFAYVCDCREHAIATVTHNRIQRGQLRHCNICKTNLRRAK